MSELTFVVELRPWAQRLDGAGRFGRATLTVASTILPQKWTYRVWLE